MSLMVNVGAYFFGVACVNWFARIIFDFIEYFVYLCHI